ncbi:hypothetical protein [Nonomuraea sp. CA-141351]|uniref:hypothetical protein n=1 Tax=Nonomuraea sp. CA-141351 TaxID=3239996 RepID=UPI003D8C2EC1
MHDMMAAILGDLDPDTAANRIALKQMVTRQITCPKTGVVLDVRQAVACTLRNQDGSHIICFVFEAAYWDANRAEIDNAAAAINSTVEVLDGRVLFAN